MSENLPTSITPLMLDFRLLPKGFQVFYNSAEPSCNESICSFKISTTWQINSFEVSKTSFQSDTQVGINYVTVTVLLVSNVCISSTFTVLDMQTDKDNLISLSLPFEVLMWNER